MSEVTIGLLTLPAGTYMLNGSVGLERTAGTGGQTGYCILHSPDGDFPIVFGFIAWGIDEAGANALAGAVELVEAGDVTLACAHTAGGGTVDVNSFTFAAIQVATLTTQ